MTTTVDSDTTTDMNAPQRPSNAALGGLIRIHLPVVEAGNEQLQGTNSLISSFIKKAERTTTYKEHSFLLIIPTALSLGFSIVLCLGANSGNPSWVEVYKFTHLFMSIGCFVATAVAFYSFQITERFDLFLDSNRKMVLIQTIAHVFLLAEISRAIMDLLTSPETFHPTIIDTIFLWGCVNSTLIAMFAQKGCGQQTSGNLYDDIQDSLMEFFLPLLMLANVMFQRLTSVMLRASKSIFHKPAAIL